MENKRINDFNANVRIYYDELKKHKPITKTKERRLLRQCKKGDIKARDELLNANLRFVFEMAKRYGGRGVGIAELISEGNVALIKALEKFDMNRDVKFISYAVWWIRQAMLELIKKKQLLDSYSSEPILEKEETFERILLDDEDDKVSYYEVVVPEEEEEANTDIYEKQKKIIGELLFSLNDREKDIIESFYGLGDRKELTLTEIGKEYGLSTERVRQIKLSAIRKLRSSVMMYDESFEEIFTT